jgi:signal transduction histidine kinase
MKNAGPTYKDFIIEDPDHPGVLYFGGARMALLDIEEGFWNLRKHVETLVGSQLTDFTMKQAGIYGGASFAKKYISRSPIHDSPNALRDCIAAYQAAGFGQFEIELMEWPVGRVRIKGIDTFESWMFLRRKHKVDAPVCAYTAGVFVGFVNVIANRDDVVCIKGACQAMGDETCYFELLSAESVGPEEVFVRTPALTLGSQMSLLEISRNLAIDIELESLLGSILEELRNVVEYDGSTILTIEGSYLEVSAYRGQMPVEEALKMRFPLDDPLDSLVIEGRKAVVVSDTMGNTPEAQAFRDSVEEKAGSSLAHIRSWMGVPLLVRDRIIGELALDHHEPNFFQTDHAELTSAFANQVAVAIENARLYRETKQAAVLAERSRLARELHDSVSQSLYGIALGTRTARKILEQAQLDEEIKSNLEKPLDYVLQLADSGLSEMRALIFELHPDVLDEQGIVIALDRLASSLQTRHDLKVEVVMCDEPPISFDLKEAIYRIVQEAFNNIIKHADANQINLELQATQSGIFLEVEDNGIGFDPEQDYAGHLGIRSMQERVKVLGGSIEIESVTGSGTTIRCQFPIRPNVEKSE